MRVKFALIGVMMCLIAAPANAVVFEFSEGNLAASADFNIITHDGGNFLQVTLSNTSIYDVTNPAGVLTAIFFDLPGNATLSTHDIALGSGSLVYYNGSQTSASLQGQWVYNPSLVAAPGGASQGISGVGFSIFGPNAPNQFFLPPRVGDAPDGLAFGILSIGDIHETLNGGMERRYLIDYSLVFTLGNLPAGFDVTQISNVTFQYGTSLTEPHVSVPEPGTMMLLGVGLIGMAGWGRKRFRNSNTP